MSDFQTRKQEILDKLWKNGVIQNFRRMEDLPPYNSTFMHSEASKALDRLYLEELLSYTQLHQGPGYSFEAVPIEAIKELLEGKGE